MDFSSFLTWQTFMKLIEGLNLDEVCIWNYSLLGNILKSKIQQWKQDNITDYELKSWKDFILFHFHWYKTQIYHFYRHNSYTISSFLSNWKCWFNNFWCLWQIISTMNILDLYSYRFRVLQVTGHSYSF